MRIEGNFGLKIISQIERVKMPVSKANLLKKYGNQIVAFQWDNDRPILLKDLLNYITIGLFNSKFELADELLKAYRRYKYENFN